LTEWPEWWEWELELCPHVGKRMAQRDFNEIDLRRMLSNAYTFYHDKEAGRFIIRSKRHGNKWEIIVEPDYEERLLVVITAYPDME